MGFPRNLGTGSFFIFWPKIFSWKYYRTPKMDCKVGCLQIMRYTPWQIDWSGKPDPTTADFPQKSSRDNGLNPLSLVVGCSIFHPDRQINRNLDDTSKERTVFPGCCG